MVDEPVNLLDRLLAEAEAQLAEATGGAPVCRVGDEPGDRPVKRAEGSMAALADVRRAARGAGAPDERTLAALADATLEEWSVAATATADWGPAWVAYRRGGIDALRALLDELRLS